METCAVCGFVWDDVADAEVASRIRAGAEMLARLLRNAPDVANTRPTPDRWSMLEYGAHVRDVMLVLRDRFVVGVVTDNPGFTPMYRDERVALGMYAGEEAVVLATEVEAAAALLVRMLEALSPEQLDRTCQYGYPGPSTRTLRWMAAQAVHEIEHHLGDVEQNLTLVAD
ncbi:MAG TPA: DinB family protein [Ilumatobacteraceae bacterium]|nr:DinB family protein [Ilumatobacteraceae bacterium]